jgi:hypothetical protein
MNQNEQQICPWCQMEIIWDPEFGPESECPHCLNELGEYRTLPLIHKDKDQEIAVVDEVEDDQEDDEDNEGEQNELLDDYDDDYNDDLKLKYNDVYQEHVSQCLDTQAEAPECFRCQELMLLAGVQKVETAHFIPEIPEALEQPFLQAPFDLHVFVCPSCFKTETMLSPDDRTKMVQNIKGKA